MRRLTHALELATVIAAPLPALADAISLQDVMEKATPLPQATIFVAKEFITMDPKKPRAEAVAVVGGKIVAVGSRADLERLAGVTSQDFAIRGGYKNAKNGARCPFPIFNLRGNICLC